MPSNIKANGVDLDTLFAPHVVNDAAYATGYKVGGVDISNRYDPLANAANQNKGSRIPALGIKTTNSSWPDNTDLASIFCGNILQYSTAASLTSSTTTGWGSISQLIHEVSVTFATAQARSDFFFFGGRIILSASRTGGTVSANNTAFSNMLANAGMINFYDAGTYATGTGTVAASIGNSSLTSSFQQIYFTTSSALYSNDYYKIEVRTSSSNVLLFRMTFQNGGAGFVADTLNGTLTSNVAHRRYPAQAAPAVANTIPLP